MRFLRSARGAIATTAAVVAGIGLVAGAGGAAAREVHANSTMASAKATKVNMLVVPQASAAPFYVGVKEGFYAKLGIKLKINTTGNFNLLISQVVSGADQFVEEAPIEMIQAEAEGLKFDYMANINGNTKTDGSGIFTKSGAGITRPKDLDGKTVCVAAVNSIQTLIINTAVLKNGGQPSTVKYVAVPFPAAVAAINSGECDAGELAEPFSAQGLQAGLVKAFDPVWYNGGYGWPLSGAYGSATWVKAHPTLAQGFATATVEAVEYCIKHPSVVRSLLPAITGVTKQVAQTELLPGWYYQIQETAYQQLADNGFNQGLVKSEVDVKKSIFSGAKLAPGK